MKYLQKNSTITKEKLDLKDKKILFLLSENSRMPLTQLSKKVALSRDAVNYRIKKYESIGLIQGYRTVVDISKFNYKANHLFVRLNNPSEEKEKKILDKIIKFPFVRAVIKFIGSYDFEIAFVSKDLDDLDNVLEKILSCFSDSLQSYELLTISKIFLAKNLTSNFLEHFPKQSTHTNSNFKTDKIDIKILKIISKNATIPLAEIAGKVNLSADAVAYRIRNLVSGGVIIKFVPVFNYISLGYNLYSVLLDINGFNQEKEKIMKDYLLSDKNSLWAVKTIGRFNVLIYFLVKDINDLQNSIFNLRSLFPKQISHYETLIGYEEYKYTYFPEDLF